MKRKTNLRASIAANHVTVVVAKFTEKEKEKRLVESLTQ